MVKLTSLLTLALMYFHGNPASKGPIPIGCMLSTRRRNHCKSSFPTHYILHFFAQQNEVCAKGK